ncbi:SMP-30/Gluconolaconase/LRE-like region-containing protein [Granulicella rosea]|uniref:SMP-30/Gluconolaconase/LRE-like region-containing protein n=1 Tax=Granulicella rosea TaxID=474952 RepID=A0A239MKM4_9BACT|nr:Ig-like domain repeat protein [Granulicella rosea]SNT42672.1 SMP-30/Gluconolaconase/LRE-like region-containing protein [Granulicella rosea]
MRNRYVTNIVTTATTLLLSLGASIGTAASAQSFTPPAAATSTTTMPYSDLVQSQAIAVDSSGNIFFSRPASGILAEKPANGGAEITLYTAPSGGGGYPKGVAANDTYAYLTDYAGHLWQVAIAGGAATDILSSCSGIDNGYLGSQEVAVDGLGNVYVAGNNETTLFKITQAGACSVVSGVTLDANSHVSADAVGDLSYSTNGVLYSMPVGATAGVAVPGTFNSIIGLRADSAGDVFVTTYSGIVEVPFLGGALDGTRAFTVLAGSSQNDVAVAPSGTLYTTDGTNIFKNTLGTTRYSATAVGTASAAQTVTAVFNSTQVLSGIRYAAGAGISTEIVNAGTGSCAIGQSYAPGSTCTINLSFTPQGIGARNGAVILSSASGVIGSIAIAGQGSGAGLVLDPGTQSNVGSAWQSPAGVAVGPSGEVLVSDKTAGTVSYFAPGSTSAVVIATGLTQPGAIAIAADGTAYIATSNGTILQAPYTGAAYGTAAVVVTGLKSPGGIAIGPGGSLYVANTGAGTVLRYPNQSGTRNFAAPSVVGSGFKAPTGLAFDAGGNLYVADASAGSIFKVAGTTTTTVATSLTSPAGVAVDDSGSLYVLQTGIATVLRIPYTNGNYGSNSTTALGNGLTTLASFAADSAGNLYVADSGAPAVISIRRTAGSLNLGRINVGSSSSAQSLSLSNDGDLSLTLGSPLYVASGNTTDFALSNSSSNACSNGGSLISGAACGISGTFTPNVIGTRTETLALSTNAANATAITGAFTGTGINLPKTTLTLTTNPSGTVSYGTNVTATALVAAPTGSTIAPTGTVTFLLNGTSYKVVALSGGTVSAVISGLPGGANTIAASYSGDANYAASSGAPQTITVTLLASTTTFTSSITSATAVPPGSSATLTATVLSSVTGAKPTGTVNFTGSGLTLATATVNPATGVAVVTTTTLPTGVYAITAVYSGDAGFAPSSSASITVSIRTPQFDIGSAPTTLNVSAPGSVGTAFSIVPISGYVGGVDMACSGLPANTQCSFLPATVALNGSTAPQSVQLTIATYTPPPTTVAAWMAPFAALLLLGLWRKRMPRYAMTLACVLIAGAALVSLNGCGGNTASTPKGSSTVTVTLTGTPNGTTTTPANGTGNIVKSFSFTLNVQ